jgi:HAE1 family hydrophobic/amphiphilic exporter-1
MLISDFAIKRPLVTVVSMVALVLFGLVALFKLKTDEFPDVQPPFVTVGVPYPGASPDGVEKEILDPIEEQITAIAGVKQVQGKAYDGYANIIVEFQFGKNLTEATQEIRDAISGIRSDLPTEMKEPVVKKLSDTDVPIISLALASSTMSQAQLSDLADPRITRELRSIGGVAEVQVFGRVERELSVLLRPEALQANGVSVAEVVQALQLQNIAAPVGRIDGALDERSIRLKAGSPIRASSRTWSSPSAATGRSCASARWPTCATAPRRRARWRSSTGARRSASTSRRRRDTAPPTSATG